MTPGAPTIDPDLETKAIAEGLARYPQFAGYRVKVRALPLFQGFAWQLSWDPPSPGGQDAWEFQNTVTRAYRRLAGL